MRKLPTVLAVGGAHIDRRGRMSGPYAPGASNPGTMHEEVGGGAFNALRTAVRRGVCASMLSVRGGDAAADSVAQAIEAAGIADISAVFLDRTTPSYTALLDRDGELIAGFADMALYDIAFPRQMARAKVRDAIAAVDAVLCDANLPSSALARLVASSEATPVFAIAISPAKVIRLQPVLADLALLFMNRREVAALTGIEHGAPGTEMTAALRRAGLQGGVVTSGNGPVLGFDSEGDFIIAPPPTNVTDVTGAGDALAGATIAALLRGLTLRAALREGMAAAMLAVASPNAVPDFTATMFAKALALVPEALEVA